MILVVDDHDDSRRVLLRLLLMDGYEGIGVTSGAEALLFLRTHTPRLVIVDYHMPDVDGLEVFHAMRREPRLAGVRAIMFSAEDGDLRDRALAAGLDAFVLKGSLDWGRLRNEIQRLAGPGAATPNAPPAEAPAAKRLGPC
jgi:CheY-like chemotaxis protein